MNIGQMPPQSYEEEKVVLGTLMNDKSALDEVREILNPECFYNDFNRQVYEAIIDISNKGDRPDYLTVYNYIKRKQPCDLMAIMSISECNTYDIYQHAAILFDKAKRRKFIEIGTLLVANGFSEAEDIVDIVTKATDQLNEMFDGSDNHIVKVDEVIKEVIEQINRNSNGTCELLGTPTGFYEIDRKANGWQKSDFIVIAGETSQGKTAFAITTVLNAALSGAKIAIYSLEMKNSQLTGRMLAQCSGIPSTTILYQKFDEQRFRQLDASLGGLMSSEIYFDDRSTSNIDTIIASIRTMKKKKNIDGVVIDYLQVLNVNSKNTNKEQFMGDVARRLKNLAKELDIWIIALSQLNRDNNNPEPTLNRLRDSGQIAEAADVVILIYRPEKYNRQYPEPFRDKDTKGTAMIDLAKGRNIGTCKFICGFNELSQKFYDSDTPIIEQIKEPISTPF